VVLELGTTKVAVQTTRPAAGIWGGYLVVPQEGCQITGEAVSALVKCSETLPNNMEKNIYSATLHSRVFPYSPALHTTPARGSPCSSVIGQQTETQRGQ
jgi:hypothetical protein